MVLAEPSGGETGGADSGWLPSAPWVVSRQALLSPWEPATQAVFAHSRPFLRGQGSGRPMAAWQWFPWVSRTRVSGELLSSTQLDKLPEICCQLRDPFQKGLTELPRSCL